MSIQTVAHKFVELCRQGKNFDVMRTMYSPNISPSKATARRPPAGTCNQEIRGLGLRQNVQRRDRGGPVLSRREPRSVRRLLYPRRHPQATGKRITLEEIGILHVKNDLSRASSSITREATDPLGEVITRVTIFDWSFPLWRIVALTSLSTL